MITRYLKRRVWILETSCETPLDCVIIGAFEDCGQFFYRCRIDGEKEPFDLPVNNIQWIRPQKTRVLNFPNKKNLAIAK